MINVNANNHFHRKYFKLIKRHPEIDPIFKTAVQTLRNQSRPAHLKIHKLSGDLKDLWSFSLNSDLRVIFRYEKNGILLVNIGSHDDVY